MKFQILNNEELGFFNTSGNKTATIQMSGSDLLLNPSASGNVILGSDSIINDIEIGIDEASSNMTFLGGGTISSNGGILTIGNPVNNDSVVLFNTTFSSSVNFPAPEVRFTNLPTSDPEVSGKLFTTQSANTGGNLDGQLVVLISQG